jgi:probable rRNA maturation factor
VTAASVDLQIVAGVDLPENISVDHLSGFVAYILDREGASGDWSLGIRFTSDDEIQRLHRDFMGIDTPTDIMTFPYGGLGEGFPGKVDHDRGGDLVISVDQARDNAALAVWTINDELLFLVAHGVLHLLGWNDHSDAERDAMLARQHELLKDWQGRPDD